MQDPEVAAAVADSVVAKLQDYVTAYRTKKAAGDCEYWEKLYKEKQTEYYEAQQKYANYVDENKNLFTQRSKIEGERLQNEMNLAFQIYNQWQPNCKWHRENYRKLSRCLQWWNLQRCRYAL